MSGVFYPAPTVSFVHGESNTVLVGQTRLLALVNVLVLRDEAPQVASPEVSVVSYAT